MAGKEVRKFLEELEERGEGEGGLERVVFCIFEEKDQRAYGEWLPYVYPRFTGRRNIAKKNANVFLLFSKIFPPTREDLATKEEPEEAEAAIAKPAGEDASAVSNDTSGEPQAKKLKTSTEDLGGEDWEDVEKPSQTATEVSEGGEVEAVELGGSGGKEVEEPVAEQKEETKVGALQPESLLAKDW